MPRVRFPFLSKSFTERDKSRQAGRPPKEGDGDRGEEERGEEHLGGQTAICRHQRGHLICHSGAEDTVLSGLVHIKHMQAGAVQSGGKENTRNISPEGLPNNPNTSVLPGGEIKSFFK